MKELFGCRAPEERKELDAYHITRTRLGGTKLSPPRAPCDLLDHVFCGQPPVTPSDFTDLMSTQLHVAIHLVCFPARTRCQHRTQHQMPRWGTRRAPEESNGHEMARAPSTQLDSLFLVNAQYCTKKTIEYYIDFNTLRHFDICHMALCVRSTRIGCFPPCEPC